MIYVLLPFILTVIVLFIFKILIKTFIRIVFGKKF